MAEFSDPFLTDWHQGYVIAPLDGHAHAEMRRVGVCPRCLGAGRVDVTQPNGEIRVGRCRCQKLPDAIARWNASGVPSRYSDCSLESYNSKLPGASIGHTLVRHWLKDFKPGSRGLVLEGEPGRGKTHLLCGVLRELVFAHGASVRFVEFSHLLSSLKESFDKRGADPVRLSELTKVSVLAIDELGKGRKTEWELAIIDELVSRSYNQGTVLLGTTNFPSKPGKSSGTLATGGLESLSDRLGERVFSRLQEMVSFAAVKGDDFRARR